MRLHVNYVRSLEGAGLVPLVVPPLADPARAASALDACAALLLTGGEDVDPARYGARRHVKTGVPNAMRDATELALLAAAHERRLPVLAICRGIQLVNVAFGGTLVQDLPSERPSTIHHDQSQDRTIRTHDVNVTPGSLLAAAIGATSVAVNSYHHQAVDRVAPGLTVTATAPDFVVEGL